MTDATATTTAHAPGSVYGVIAEFSEVDAVMKAARATRKAGYKKFDVHSPFPIHGIDDAMGIRPTILPWIVLGGGLTGMVTGLVMTIYTMSNSGDLPGAPVNVEGYGYLISGKPLNSLPAWIPVVFELTILLASFGAVFGMFLLNKLPMLHHPLLTSSRFKRATADRFYVCIEAGDPSFELDKVQAFLAEQGAEAVELIEEHA